MSRTYLAPGCYFDGWRGWTISGYIVRLAVELGYDNSDARLIAVQSEDGWRDNELLHDVANDAEAYIQASHVPEGYYCGTAEGDNSWGVWAIGGEDQ